MDNAFLTLLGFVFMISWLGGSIFLIVAPIVWAYRGISDIMDAVIAIIMFVIGVSLLLLFMAVLTGGVHFSGIRDGCYHVYYVHEAKSGHYEYDPIQCPAGISG